MHGLTRTGNKEDANLEWKHVVNAWGGQRWHIDTGEYRVNIFAWPDRAEWYVYNRSGNKTLGTGKTATQDEAKMAALNYIASRSSSDTVPAI